MTIIDEIEMRNCKIILNSGSLDDKHEIVPLNLFVTRDDPMWKIKS